LACALVIILAMTAAGIVHTFWMRSPRSNAFRIALDGGLSWRGQRIFGANKMLRGFMVLVPAAGAAFALLGLWRHALPAWIDAGLWQLSPGLLFLLGSWAGFWFMAGELPNSFLKRRWGVAPGSVPVRGSRRTICLLADRLDSVVALLIALSVVVPVHWLAWVWVLLFGPAVHFGFSAMLYLAGVKARVA
jgi:hypothetical protein